MTAHHWENALRSKLLRRIHGLENKRDISSLVAHPHKNEGPWTYIVMYEMEAKSGTFLGEDPRSEYRRGNALDEQVVHTSVMREVLEYFGLLVALEEQVICDGDAGEHQ